MGTLTDKLLYYTDIVLFLLCGMILCGVIFYFYRAHKRKNRKLDEDSTDYSNFDRKDTAEYLKFLDDIKDDMYILDGKTRFVGAIRCHGFDFYSAQVEEQAVTAQNYASFINIIKRPMSYRQYSKAVNLEHTQTMYQEAHKRVEEQLFNVSADLEDLKKMVEQQPENAENFNINIQELERKKRALENREAHLLDEIAYCEEYSGGNIAPELQETYLFEWVFNPNDFPVKLTEEEILTRAKQELKSLENSMVYSLSICRVHAVRCKTEELIEMFRRYSSPLSADRYRLRDLLSSSYFEDIVTSDSTDKLVKMANNKVKESFIDNFEDNLKNSVGESVHEPRPVKRA